MVGARLRYHREGHTGPRLTQDEVAAAAQRLGFPWGRSTVAAIEAGDREISAEELLALPFILSEAVAQFPGFTAAGMPLSALALPGKTARLALSEHLELTHTQAQRYLERGDPAYRVKTAGDAVTEADRKAARRLGVEVDVLLSAAYTLWDRSLPAERDRRVSGRSGPDATARTVQALRGHVTRELLGELADYLEVNL